jgi:hypothetical protein
MRGNTDNMNTGFLHYGILHLENDVKNVSGG